MRRYKNVSRTLLHLDCMDRTVHLGPGEETCLPVTRDVRFYLKTRQLIVLREEKKPKRKRRKKKVIKPHKRRGKASFKKKDKEIEKKPEEQETEKFTKMETE